MTDVLIVVDMQNDFIDGALGTPEAQAILPELGARIAAHVGPIFYTLDTHDDAYLTSQEGRHLPVPHCIAGTPGHDVAPAVLSALAAAKAVPIVKDTFGGKALVEALQALSQTTPLGSITLMGLCTDICVISNALLLKAYFPEVPIVVPAAACAGVTPESHERALAAMAVCQVAILD